MFKILTLNNISKSGLVRFPFEKYEVSSEIKNPDIILLRSADMHGMNLPETVKGVSRAGAGINNIPVGKLTKMGIPVFNTPGANANAVKELVIASMIISYRNICHAMDFARTLEGDDKKIMEAVESGTSRSISTR